MYVGHTADSSGSYYTSKVPEEKMPFDKVIKLLDTLLATLGYNSIESIELCADFVQSYFSYKSKKG